MKSKQLGVFLLAALALVISSSGPAYAQITGQGLHSAGPIAGGPLDLFPKWYMDKTGIALEGCLDGPPLCLSSLADLGNPAIGEAFYWSATADLTHPSGAGGFVEFALEMAFLNPVIDQANAMIFNRMRVRLTGLPVAGPYTMDHPYGQVVFTATPEPQLTTFEINETVDLPGSSGPVSFGQVLAAPNIGPFLRQIGAPTGFLGDPNVPRLVTGGPNGNSITFTGPGISMTTNLFAVEGKLATNGGISGVRANYSRTATGDGILNIFASSIAGQRIIARIGGGANARVVGVPRILGQLGNYRANVPFTALQRFQPISVRNATDASKPAVFLSTARDVVAISRATFLNGILTVAAASTDQFAPGPLLRLFDNAGTLLAQGNGQISVNIASPINPGRVRVTSSAGGVATRVVQ